MTKQKYDENIRKIIERKIIKTEKRGFLFDIIKRKRELLLGWLYDKVWHYTTSALKVIIVFLMIVGFSMFVVGVFTFLITIKNILLPTENIDTITQLLITVDTCLIAVTVILLGRDVHNFLAGVTKKLEIDENVAKMGTATTIIIFLTIIMQIGKSIKDITSTDFLYLAIAVSIFIISLSIFLLIMIKDREDK